MEKRRKQKSKQKGENLVAETSKNFIYQDSIDDISSTNDIKTNDFDLTADKVPPLSTIKTQIKKAKALIGTDISNRKADFDRLKIAVHLPSFCDYIGFDDFWLEDTKEPWKRPSYNNRDESVYEISSDDEEDEFISTSDSVELDDDDWTEFDKQIQELSEKEFNNVPETPSGRYKNVSRRICYEKYKGQLGLNNIYIHNDYFIIDITGKWMATRGVLGCLNINNIHEALQRILDLNVVEFDVERLLKIAQVFLCDVCIDLRFLNRRQCLSVITGISSFAPLSTNKFFLGKYGRHGINFIAKAKNTKCSFAIYYKGQELINNKKNSSKTSNYLFIIGEEGETIANSTLRFEVKLQNFETIRKILCLENKQKRIVSLLDVLNSTAPVVLNFFEDFCFKPEELFDRLLWMQDVLTTPEKMTLNEILAAERFIEILEENKFDLIITRKHMLTEYVNVKDEEIEHLNFLANQKRNIVNFLVYKKPKSTTIILDVLNRLYQHYSTEEKGAE